MTQKLLTKAKGICCKCGEWVGFIPVGVIAVAALTWIIHCSPGTCLDDPPWWLPGIRVALPFLLVLTAIHFIFVFTRHLPGNGNADSNGDNKSLSPPLRKIFVYGYVFMFAALGLCGLLFFLPLNPISNDGSSKARIPAGIVAGYRCVECTKAEDQEPQWFLHVGSSVSKLQRNENHTAVLKGGLAVPLYVVFLALMGGAVSMIRRVPEYQKRATPKFWKEWKSRADHDIGKEQPILEIRARELVIFQIMQMFTGPLIAVTAYGIFSPAEVAAGGLMGFLSGFASETILLRLRKTADALSGRTK